MTGNPDALRALEAAKKTAKARAQAEAAAAPKQDPSDRDETECFIHLVISMYSAGLKMGVGVMPDGMAIYIRLSFPSTSTDERAGMVSFLVSQDTKSVLNKAVDALEASERSQYWKVDRYAVQSAV
jgi:hypothetical protein